MNIEVVLVFVPLGRGGNRECWCCAGTEDGQVRNELSFAVPMDIIAAVRRTKRKLRRENEILTGRKAKTK